MSWENYVNLIGRSVERWSINRWIITGGWFGLLSIPSGLVSPTNNGIIQEVCFAFVSNSNFSNWLTQSIADLKPLFEHFMKNDWSLSKLLNSHLYLRPSKIRPILLNSISTPNGNWMTKTIISILNCPSRVKHQEELFRKRWPTKTSFSYWTTWIRVDCTEDWTIESFPFTFSTETSSVYHQITTKAYIIVEESDRWAKAMANLSVDC